MCPKLTDATDVDLFGAPPKMLPKIFWNISGSTSDVPPPFTGTKDLQRWPLVDYCGGGSELLSVSKNAVRFFGSMNPEGYNFHEQALRFGEILQ